MAKLILKDVRYHYPKSERDVLNGISVSFESGVLSTIRGRSGAGKSTLLHLLAGMDVPTGGYIVWDEKTLTKSGLDAYRRNDVGLIAQSYLLFPTRTALENVCYPMQLAGGDPKQAKKKAADLLLSVGLGTELHHRLPARMSGGEQQRVGIARCLAGNRRLIVADEPTGNLDDDNAMDVMKCLLSLAHDYGKLVIVVTHDTDIAEMADRRYYLSKGELRLEE